MAEITKPDYLSLVNKGGSGFNISELVTSIVASEIEPKRSIQTSKQEKTENAISGIGYLNSQAAITQSNFETLTNDKFFSVASSNASAFGITVTDEMKLSPGNRTISDISIAKKMVFELGGFSNLTDQFTANLSIDFGTWSKSSAADTSLTSDFTAAKTYVVTGAITGDDASEIATKSSWAGGDLAAGDTFTVTAGQSGSIASELIREVDTYAFSAADVTSPDATVSFTNKTLSQVAALIEAESGLTAKIIDTNGDGSNYSLAISSEETGAKSGFKISGHNRWLTPEIPDSHSIANSIDNNFSQIATDATFKLDGVSVTRTKNKIDDILDGAEIELKSDLASSAIISSQRSEDAIKSTVNSLISSLNEFKAEIDRLTFIDVEGDENGPLSMDPAVTSLKTSFKRLSIRPITGYGENPIYLSQLGVKTDSTGNYFLDENTFAKTMSSNPTAFSALKDDNISTNNASISASKPSYTTIEAATYDVTAESDGSYTIKKSGSSDAAITLLTIPQATGGVKFTSTQFPGLSIESPDANPSSFKLFIGDSFSKKVSNLMTEMLDLNSSVYRSNEAYKSTKEDIEERLEKLEIREKLITTQYTERFGEMEKSMTQFNSTKTMLENFIEAWKKQK